MTATDDELWLQRIRGEEQAGHAPEADEARILREQMLALSKQLDQRAPRPSTEGLAVVRARVHQARAIRPKPRKLWRLMSVVSLVAALGAALSQAIVPMTLTATRGEDVIWSSNPKKDGHSAFSDLERLGATPKLMACWSLSYTRYGLCIPEGYINGEVIAIDFNGNRASEEWLFETYSDISPTQDENRRLKIFFKQSPRHF